MSCSEVVSVCKRLMLVQSVLVDGESIASASSRIGLSRVAAYKWLVRYAEEGEKGLVSRSRRPLNSPHCLSLEWQEQILALKVQYPYWGAKKLCALLGDGAPCSRTIDRYLHRQGLVGPHHPKLAVGRWEKEFCNELWQLDHKGVPQDEYPIFGCIDDASRFCIALSSVENQSLDAFWEVLWDAFGSYGLPDAILCDNGPAFKNLGMKRLSSFELRLLLLGIKPLHGRPYHPQTQGKIERFFGTMDREHVQELESFRHTYNTIRPHESISQRTPASVYQVSSRTRPDEMPPIILPTGCQTRRTDQRGTFSYKGQDYRVGRSLAQKTIGIKEDEIYYGHVNVDSLQGAKL